MFAIEPPTSLVKLRAEAITLQSFFSFLLFLQYLSRFFALSYYCSILVRRYSNFINFFLITLFISLLNSFTNGLFLYLLLFATLWKSCTNSFIVLLFYYIFFNFTIFIVPLSLPLNFLFKSIRNSFTITYSNFPLSKFSMMFSFQISANSSCTYDNIY